MNLEISRLEICGTPNLADAIIRKHTDVLVKHNFCLCFFIINASSPVSAGDSEHICRHIVKNNVKNSHGTDLAYLEQ